MKNRAKDVQRIEKAFGQAHRNSPPLEPGPYFEQRVMTRVLEKSPVFLASAETSAYLGRAAWRFALVGYLVVFALTAQLMLSDMDSQYQLARLVLDDTSSSDLIDTFGML